MSNDPFQEKNPNAPARPPFGNDGGFSGQDPPPPKRRTWLWVLLIVAGLGFVSLMICCGLGAFGVSKFGAVVFEPVREELNAVEQVQSSVGRVEKLSMNFGATVKEAESYPDFIILDAETANGPCQFSVKMGAAGEVEAAYLIDADGKRTELDVTLVGDPDPNSFSPENGRESLDDESTDSPMDATEKELRELESALDLK